MKTVIEMISKAFSQTLEAVVLLIIVTAVFYLLNILFGTILGSNEIGFVRNKFLFGFVKGFTACLGIFAFCYTLNLFALALALIDVEISVTVITVLEVLGVMVTWDIDLATEIYDKIKSLKELKYVSYDDVKYRVNDYDADNHLIDEIENISEMKG